MHSIEYMRRHIAPWGSPLDIAVVAGKHLNAQQIPELDRLRESWRDCGGGTVHPFDSLDEALVAVRESVETWHGAIAADTGLPAENLLGVVAAVYESFPVDGDWKNSPLDRFYRTLASMPVVRVLISGDSLTRVDLDFFNNGLIDMRMALDSDVHVQDKEAWRVLANEVRNLVFNRLSAGIPGIWNARPHWLTDSELNNAVCDLLEAREICSWEWITDPNRLQCTSVSGDVAWFYAQTREERTRARLASRGTRTAQHGNVVSIAPATPQSDRTPQIIIDAGPDLTVVEAEWLMEVGDISFAWRGSEL